MRWSKGKRDENEPPIIRALERAGATVIRLAPGELADLLVGYRRLNWLLEIKNPEVKHCPGAPNKRERAPGGDYEGCLPTMSRSQWDEIQRWPGARVRVVETVEQALEALGACASCKAAPSLGTPSELGSGLCVDCEMTQARGY